MRIAVVYPLAAWSTRDVASGWASALRALGHEVVDVDLWRRACEAGGATEPRFYARAMTPEARKAALDSLREVRADRTLVVHGRDLPEAPPRSVLLLTDEPYELAASLRRAKAYDLVVTNDPATLEAHRANHPRVEYLPPAFDPEVMRPDPAAAPAYDVAFVGTWFRERVRFLEEAWPALEGRARLLAGYWFRPGDRLPAEDLPGESPLRKEVKEMIVWPAELCRVYQRSRVALNVHRGSLWYANPDAVVARGVNPRLFEIAGTGAFQLVDERPEVRACFDPDEVPSFEDATSCAVLIREWLSPGRESERRATAARALARARSAHTYEVRARTLTAWMTED